MSACISFFTHMLPTFCQRKWNWAGISLTISTSFTLNIFFKFKIFFLNEKLTEHICYGGGGDNGGTWQTYKLGIIIITIQWALPMYHAVVYYKITHLVFVPSSWRRASITLGTFSVQRVCFVIYNELLFTIPEFMLMKLFKTRPFAGGWEKKLKISAPTLKHWGEKRGWRWSSIMWLIL